MRGVLEHLGRTCLLARETAGLRQIDIATAAGTDNGVVSRFESGERLPRDLDRLVAAYGSECGVEPYELWRQALDAWDAADPQE
jgi:transcriptional regulator with XRE-family HTH domain